jgi:hypothetical protein
MVGVNSIGPGEREEGVGDRVGDRDGERGADLLDVDFGVGVRGAVVFKTEEDDDGEITKDGMESFGDKAPEGITGERVSSSTGVPMSSTSVPILSKAGFGCSSTIVMGDDIVESCFGIL